MRGQLVPRGAAHFIADDDGGADGGGADAIVGCCDPTDAQLFFVLPLVLLGNVAD
jgi:hypothetical protein